jgi:hypothetical protein
VAEIAVLTPAPYESCAPASVAVHVVQIQTEAAEAQPMVDDGDKLGDRARVAEAAVPRRLAAGEWVNICAVNLIVL